MKSKIIIGDVHGSFNTLKALIEKLPHKNIAFVGDLVDRGPYSMQVVQYIINNNFDCVKGNHEQMMIDYGKGDRYADYIWLSNGGEETIKSYNGDESKFKEHTEWMSNLPTYIKYEDVMTKDGYKLIISHSMAYAPLLAPKYYPKEKADEEIMWSRNFRSIKPIPNYYNIFGHTPQQMGPRIKSFFSCIDTGVCYNSVSSKRLGYGVLTAMEYPSKKIWTQENIDE